MDDCCIVLNKSLNLLSIILSVVTVWFKDWILSEFIIVMSRLCIPVRYGVSLKRASYLSAVEMCLELSVWLTLIPLTTLLRPELNVWDRFLSLTTVPVDWTGSESMSGTQGLWASLETCSVSPVDSENSSREPVACGTVSGPVNFSCPVCSRDPVACGTLSGPVNLPFPVCP